MTSLSQPQTPPTGEPPFNGPKTWQRDPVLEIHRALRRSFGEATKLVDGVADGDTKHATAVATQRQLDLDRAPRPPRGGGLSDCLGHGERPSTCMRPSCRPDEALTRTLACWRTSKTSTRTLPAWRATATKASRRTRPLRAPRECPRHWPSTSRTKRPPSSRPWSMCSPRARRSGSASTAGPRPQKGQLWNMIGAILAAQPDGGAAG